MCDRNISPLKWSSTSEIVIISSEMVSPNLSWYIAFMNLLTFLAACSVVDLLGVCLNFINFASPSTVKIFFPKSESTVAVFLSLSLSLSAVPNPKSAAWMSYVLSADALICGAPVLFILAVFASWLNRYWRQHATRSLPRH